MSRSPAGSNPRVAVVVVVALLVAAAGAVAPRPAGAVTTTGVTADRETPPAPTGPVTLPAAADARVEAGRPDTNFGTDPALLVDGKPVIETYLRFDVGAVGASAASAVLRLYVTDRSSNGPKVHTAPGSWSETAVTWNNRPATGPLVADVGAVAAGGYTEWDVTDAVNTAIATTGPASFTLVADSSDGADFRSREAANPPQLVVTPAGPDTTPPDTTITSAPADPTTSTTATFAFHATEPATFACSLDGQPAAPCTSPTSYPNLTLGGHTFAVTATDTAGNPDPTAATHQWTITTGPPAPAGIIDTLAGSGTRGSSGDGGPGTAAQLSAPRTTAVAPDGSVVVADTENHRIRRIDTSGVISTIAGTGARGFSGDGGPATASKLNNPHGVAVDAAGNVFVGDSANQRIRRIDADTGIITTVAGTGASGYNGDGVAATSAQLNYPKDVTVGPDGSLYIGDANNHRVRRVDAGSGIITTVAGTGTAGFSGDGGPATAARLSRPRAVAFDPDGRMYIADDANCRVRRVGTDGAITTVAGSFSCGYGGDGGPGTTALLSSVRDVAVDTGGNLYIADERNHRIRRVDPDGTITTFAGTGSNGYDGDGVLATEASMSGPRGVTVDAAGRVVVGDTGNHRIRRVS